MLIKTIIVFLGLMVLVAMIGRALFPGAARRLARTTPKRAVRCVRCGRPQIGKSPCACKSEV
jgi:hypothetical protein